MTKLTKRKKTIEEILDSDDELPTDYIETPFIPAYQDDKRFEFIQQQNNTNLSSFEDKEQLKSNEAVIMKGYLNKKDILCFQCLETIASKKTLLWFFDYLILKDLQSKFNFLRTCLVPNINNYTSATFLKDHYAKTHNFKVTVSSR